MQENNELLNYSPEEVEAVITLAEELQTENEQQREELRQLKQNYSLEKQMLLLKIQELILNNRELQSQLVQLTEHIEKLNKSDLQLKKAFAKEKKLKEQENELRKREEEAILAVKLSKEATEKALELEKNAKKEQAAAENLKKEQTKIIVEKVNARYEKLKNKYLTYGLYVILYAVLMTICRGIFSERLISDTKKAINCLVWLVDGCSSIITCVVKKSSGIGNGMTVLTYLFGGIALLLCAAAILAVMFFGGKLVYTLYRKYCWDEISIYVSLMSVAVYIGIAEYMPLNVYLLLIITQIAYILVRWYIYGYKESRGLA